MTPVAVRALWLFPQRDKMTQFTRIREYDFETKRTLWQSMLHE